MAYTSLQEALRAQPESQQPLATASYRGAITAARFSDRDREFAALQTGCAVYDLGFRARLLITGADRVRWLNGMVTNNVRDLAERNGVYAFLLNPQGHILGDMYVFNDGDALVVETDRRQVEKIIATFDHYIIMDDVVVSETTTQTALGVSGPQARAILSAAKIQFPELKPLETISLQCDCACGCVQCKVVRADDPQYESYEIWLDTGQAYEAWCALITARTVPVGSEALEMQRIVQGIPLYGVDIRERDLPQETEQARALNFNKGCYIGQEIVERIRSRASVHRKFVGFAAESGTRISPGAKIVVDGREVGEVTSSSAVPTPEGERIISLGYIRREFAAPGHEVVIADAKAAVIQLPVHVAAIQNHSEAVMHRD
jgi:folate-binding protein YgfZ